MRLQGSSPNGVPAVSYIGTPEGSLVGTSKRPEGTILSLPGQTGAPGTSDPSTATHAATTKVAPEVGDEFPLIDSSASFSLKKLSWANFRLAIKAYYDSVAAALTNKDLTSGTNTFPTFNQSTTGNAATATKLATARNINGVAFDGTANITVADSTKEPAFAAGTSAQYYRGDKTWQTLNCDVVPDGTTNKAYTATEKTKLAGVATAATANSPDATLLARANHTGTQSADTLTDGTTNKAFLATERTKLTGIATAATANDTDANLKARANHTGTQSADTLTDGTTNKAFLATERTKLSGIATGATANSSDATLLARANHTGTQTASTVSDFSTAADARITAARTVSIAGQTEKVLQSVWANTVTPEDTAFTHFPHLFNDIAYNNSRGGSVTKTRNGSGEGIGTPTALFSPDTSADFETVNATGDVFVFTVTLCRSFDWLGWWGISQHFGNRAKDVKIERYNSVSAAWTTVLDVTNQSTAVTAVYDSGWGGSNAVTQLRFTLKNFNVAATGAIRITNIFALAYDSSLLASSFMPLGGGTLYGGLNLSNNAITNARVTPRITTINAPGATPTVATDSYDQINYTGLAAAITGFTVTGTPTDGQKLMIRLKDNGTARAITWGSSFAASGISALPTTTVISKTHLVGFIYDSATAKWVCVAADTAGY